MKNKATEILQHLFEDGFDLNATINDVDALRKEYRHLGDEGNANTAWALRTILWIHQNYRETFSLLKDRRYYDAWCLMDRVDIAIGNLLRNFPGTEDAVKFVSRMVCQLQSLYPYKIFFSTVLLIQERKCSICGETRSIRRHCGHHPGYVYGGEMCCDEITKASFLGADIVFDPEHKYSVAFATDKQGNKIDQYDYRLLESLMSAWKHPYTPWHYTTKHIHKSPAEFPGLTDMSLCPCGSGNKYGECCKNDPAGVKHVVYSFGVGK